MTNPNHTDTSRSGDLVERLRLCATHGLPASYNDHAEAADRIEALEAENERLRYHLEGTLDTLQDAEICFADCVPCAEARAALGGKQ